MCRVKLFAGKIREKEKNRWEKKQSRVEKETEYKSLTGCFIRGRMNGLRITVRGSYGGEIAGVSRGDVIARRTRRAMARCHGNGFTRSAA